MKLLSHIIPNVDAFYVFPTLNIQVALKHVMGTYYQKPLVASGLESQASREETGQVGENSNNQLPV